MKIKPVRSLNELYNKARVDKKYEQLLFTAALNLGGSARTISEAYNWLMMNAAETDEQGVVEEVNFCRDLVE
jgi:hypothetical protein